MRLQRYSNGKRKEWGFGGDRAAMAALLLPETEPKTDLFDTMVRSGISTPIDPFLRVTANDAVYPFAFNARPFMSPDAVAVALSLSSVNRPGIQIDWEQLDQTPEAVRFQLSHKYWPCAGSNNVAYELARFITRKNEVGWIKSIQTELTFENNDLRWPRGDSIWFRRNLGVDEGEVDVTWVIKVEGLPIEDINPKAFRVLSGLSPTDWINEIPGDVHPEMDAWSEMLFLFGIDHMVHLRCPQSTLVSLWMFRHEDVTADGVLGFSGMVKGFTQVMESDRTYENMTRVY